VPILADEHNHSRAVANNRSVDRSESHESLGPSSDVPRSSAARGARSATRTATRETRLALGDHRAATADRSHVRIASPCPVSCRCPHGPEIQRSFVRSPRLTGAVRLQARNEARRPSPGFQAASHCSSNITHALDGISSIPDRAPVAAAIIRTGRRSMGTLGFVEQGGHEERCHKASSLRRLTHRPNTARRCALRLLSVNRRVSCVIGPPPVEPWARRQRNPDRWQ
jgi:hypothetical protein